MPTKTISLNGQWQFTDASKINWQNGTVPGCVQMDLMALGQLPDPFYRMDEHYCHELEDKEWVYRKTFDFEGFDYDEARLVFEGIDTLADVYLNGVYLGRAENMFIPYEYDVSDVLVMGENVIEVRFDSPIKTIKALEHNSPVALASSCESARPYVRKAQYSYGWDWGPRIAQTGLWRPVHLDLIKDAKLEDAFFYTTKLEDGKAHVKVQGDVTSYINDELSVVVSIFFEDKKVASAAVPVNSQAYGLGFAAAMDIADPQLWYPNGMGAQPLYDIDVRLLKGQEEVDKLAFRSGIRTVRIVQDRDEEGTSFIFEINGVKVFAKGADWIPADNLLPRLTKKDYYQYVRLAKEANMNMIRIWGGGIYEDKAFYDTCDEMGIMVWQDFMYACAQYPDQFEWFRDLAEEEAVVVVKQLRNHPSIVLWCGNNENNWGFYSWWHNGDPEFLGNYIYKQMLPRICAEYDPSRPYWVSSPYGGKDPNSMGEGDRHAWDVWSNWQDYGNYLHDRGRFLSEFGFQAMPAWKTVLSFTAPEDRKILSPVMLAHNKMAEGMERLIRFMAGRLGLPKDLRSFVYMTQFNQAEAIKAGVEHWRSRKFKTAGAIYWQLNDCWPVASWACLDYYKRKKGLYYYSKRFFADILPVIKQEDGNIAVYGVNDKLNDVEGTLRITAYGLDGRKLGEVRQAVSLIANDVVKIAQVAYDKLGIRYTPRFMPVDLPGTTLPVEKNGELLDAVVFVELKVGQDSYTNYMVFDRFRNLNLISPQIYVEVTGNTIKVRSNAPAFAVFIETENDVDLSDNCLNLEPGVEYIIRCSADPGNIEVFDLTAMVADI